MTHPCVLRMVSLLVVLALPFPAAAQQHVQGRLTGPDGAGVSGVQVLLPEIARETVTDSHGTWAFDNVPDGTYTLTLSLGRFSESHPILVAGRPVQLSHTVEWDLRFTDTVVVYGATRRTERLIETPASASIIPAASIARESGHGQLPKLLQTAPGVEVVQSGVYDFNINLRGFNTALNRRVLTLIDGRDPGGVLLGAQEWTAYALPLEQLAQIEVIKGPSSALYGANAFNGVVNILSTEPRFDTGGHLTLTAGGRGTLGISGVHSGELHGGWFVRVFATASRSDDFYVSRVSAVEYPGLPFEARAPLDRTLVASASGRLDRYFRTGGLWTVEGGDARVSGNVYVTGIGRVQNDSIHRPWVRTSVHRGGWQVSGFADARRGTTLSLVTGGDLHDRSVKARAEVVRRYDLASTRVRLIGGATATEERIDTADATGRQSILSGFQRGYMAAAFGQVDYQATSRLTLRGAARLDAASRHPRQLSPKFGGAFRLRDDHVLRVAYGRAFQPATFGELFTRVPVAPAVELGGVEAALAPALGGVPLHFDAVPILALGNSALDVERVHGAEAGYSGVFGRRVLVSVEGYRNRLERFISALLPQIGTSLGRVNPAFGPYTPPAALSLEQRGLVLETLASVLPPPIFAMMSNDVSGAPVFAAASYANVGAVDTHGVDMALQYFPSRAVIAEVTYSAFGFKVRRDLPDDPLAANTSPHRVGAAITHVSPRLSASARYRWVGDFTWASGVFRGTVPGYHVVDVAGTVGLQARTDLRISASNVFDRRHYEMFGGDLIGRRVVADLIVRWRPRDSGRSMASRRAVR